MIKIKNTTNICCRSSPPPPPSRLPTGPGARAKGGAKYGGQSGSGRPGRWRNLLAQREERETGKERGTPRGTTRPYLARSQCGGAGETMEAPAGPHTISNSNNTILILYKNTIWLKQRGLVGSRKRLGGSVKGQKSMGPTWGGDPPTGPTVSEIKAEEKYYRSPPTTGEGEINPGNQPTVSWPAQILPPTQTPPYL